MTSRRGMSLVEVCVVIAILGLLAAILLPAVQIGRETSRRMECSSHLRQIGTAVNNYHSTFNCFPPISGHVNNLPKSIWANLLLDLGLVDLAAYDRSYGTSTATMTMDDYPEIKFPTALMQCPSDSCPVSFGANYGANLLGSGAYYFPDGGQREDPFQGIGVFGGACNYSTITDGASNTTLASEFLRGTGSPYTPLGVRIADISRPKSLIFNLIPGATTNAEIEELRSRCRDSNPTTDPIISDTRGQFWLSGTQHDYVYSHFDTPNSFSCQESGYPRGLILTVSSQHTGGVNVVYADGSVRFVSDSIDLKVWRALGTRAGNEQL